jgi:hypothetical protein
LNSINKNISISDWEKFLTGSLDPALAAVILTEGTNGRLLVEDSAEGKMFIPNLIRAGDWQLTEVIKGREGIARLLGLGDRERQYRIFDRMQLEPLAEVVKIFIPEYLYAVDGARRSIKELVDGHGLDEARAALELGLTLESFRLIGRNIPYCEHGKYLRGFLECYRDQFLPKFKTWSNRSNLLREFISTYNATPEGLAHPLEAESCYLCDHVAADLCCNPDCNPRAGHGRFVCLAHGSPVDDPRTPMGERPNVICPECVDRTAAGELPYRSLTGHWRVR